MRTKEIVWKLFSTVILSIAKDYNKKQLNFAELITIIHKAGKVYDNRTAKNYIDCMIDNQWLIPDSSNPFDMLGTYVVTTVYKYRHIKFTINESAKYDTDEQNITQLKELIASGKIK